MENNPVVGQVMVLFLTMIVGIIAAKQNIIDDHARKKLSDLLLYITSPFLVISSFNFKFSSDMLVSAGIVFNFSLAIHFFSIFLGKLLFAKYPYEKQSVLKFILVFSNCGFMGFPVLEGLFGKTGVFYGSIYVAVFNAFIWTYGVMLFSKGSQQSSVKKALINPGIISVVVGFFIFLFSIELPKPVLQTLDMVGSMTSPISMLVIGAILAETNLKDIFTGFEVYYGTVLRLVVMPLIAILALTLIGIDRELLRVCVVLVAMPAAANTVIFAEKYEANSLLASRCVALSTILSIVTIPLIMMLI